MSSFLHHMLNTIPEESPSGGGNSISLWLYFGLDSSLLLQISNNCFICNDNGDVGRHSGIKNTNTYLGYHGIYYAWGYNPPDTMSDIWEVDNDDLPLQGSVITGVTCIKAYRPDSGNEDETEDVNTPGGLLYIDWSEDYIHVVDAKDSSAVYLIRIDFDNTVGGSGGTFLENMGGSSGGGNNDEDPIDELTCPDCGSSDVGDFGDHYECYACGYAWINGSNDEPSSEPAMVFQASFSVNTTPETGQDYSQNDCFISNDSDLGRIVLFCEEGNYPYHFDASNLPRGNSSLTISLWAYLGEQTNSGDSVLLIDWGSTPWSNTMVGLWMGHVDGDPDATKCKLGLATWGSYVVDISNNLDRKRWYHICYTHDSVNEIDCFYIDGELVATDYGELNISGEDSEYEGAILGQFWFPDRANVEARVANVKVYNYALSASQVLPLAAEIIPVIDYSGLLRTPHNLTLNENPSDYDDYTTGQIVVPVENNRTGNKWHQIDDRSAVVSSYTIYFEVEQSSTLNNYDGGGPAWAAMNGVGVAEETDYVEGFLIRNHSHTRSETHPWWQIHFTNASVIVKRLLFTTRGTDYDTSAYNSGTSTQFVLQGSTDGNTFTDIANFDVTAEMATTGAPCTYQFVFNNNIAYSYYRITDRSDANHYLIIGELEFRFDVVDYTGFRKTPHNLTGTASEQSGDITVSPNYISQSSILNDEDYYSGQGSWKAFNGSLLEGESVHTQSETNPWWQIKLHPSMDADMSVQALVFTWRNRQSPGGTNFILQYSDDNTTFTDVKNFTVSNTPGAQTIVCLNGGVGYHVYWRLLGNFTDYLIIGEIEFRYFGASNEPV